MTVYIYINVIYVFYLLNNKFLNQKAHWCTLVFSIYSILQIISSQYIFGWKNKWTINKVANFYKLKSLFYSE